jgi:hypothetical protein
MPRGHYDWRYSKPSTRHYEHFHHTSPSIPQEVVDQAARDAEARATSLDPNVLLLGDPLPHRSALKKQSPLAAGGHHPVRNARSAAASSLPSSPRGNRWP